MKNIDYVQELHVIGFIIRELSNKSDMVRVDKILNTFSPASLQMMANNSFSAAAKNVKLFNKRKND